jgi:TolB-like protein/Flp pilus assembly protein TadD
VQVLGELQRRNVFRVTIGYIVSSWLLIQVADVALDNFGSPGWVMRTIMLLLALGFPMVVFFSWAYEVTPEGIKRESEIDRSQSITHVTGRKLDRAITVVLILAAGYFAYNNYLLSNALNGELAETVAQDASAKTAPDAATSESTAPQPGKSIAVLPFVNMSGDESSAYFSDGLADTVLHMLAQVAELRVAARTSSFQFRDQAMDIGEIGRQLNVSSVLEGSVQKSGDTIRVTAQLIDVSNGFHIWSGNFDRNLNDVFAIQDEIASEVVTALKLSLLGESAESLTRDHTDNLDAYTEYLLAVNDLSAISTDNLTSAVSHLHEAIRLDPEYARAYSTLGRAYLLMTFWGAMGEDQAVAAARNVASRALDIDAASSEALAVLGHAANQDGDLNLAGELLSKAIEIGPNDVVALDFYARYLGADARPVEAEAIYREIIHLDPLSETAHIGLANTLTFQSKYDEASEAVADFKIIQPNSALAESMIFYIERGQGNLAAAIKVTMEANELNPNDPDPEGQFLIGLTYLALDMPSEASRWFDRAIEIDAQHPVARAAPLFLNFYLQQNEEESFRLARELLAERIDNRHGSRLIALTILTEYGAKTGQHDIVLGVLDNLYPHLFDDPPHDLDKDFRATRFVGMALLQSGDTDRGSRLIRSVDEMAAPYREAYGTGRRSIINSLLVGDKDGALERLADLAKSPHRSNYNKLFLERSSLYDPLRDEPAFIALLDEYRKNAEEQRQILESMSQSSSGH